MAMERKGSLRSVAGTPGSQTDVAPGGACALRSTGGKHSRAQLSCRTALGGRQTAADLELDAGTSDTLRTHERGPSGNYLKSFARKILLRPPR